VPTWHVRCGSVVAANILILAPPSELTPSSHHAMLTLARCYCLAKAESGGSQLVKISLCFTDFASTITG
jgi:hypothetical protein